MDTITSIDISSDLYPTLQKQVSDLISPLIQQTCPPRQPIPAVSEPSATAPALIADPSKVTYVAFSVTPPVRYSSHHSKPTSCKITSVALSFSPPFSSIGFNYIYLCTYYRYPLQEMRLYADEATTLLRSHSVTLIKGSDSLHSSVFYNPAFQDKNVNTGANEALRLQHDRCLAVLSHLSYFIRRAVVLEFL
ncbi:hypothetical protein BD560DRAFT_436235 [Blakeslea trispora]|nr:hypothetical protein BD560DRAFT_436235 [Blakeslea trispora]